MLAGKTRGYRHHPQLERFRSSACPADVIRAYLRAVFDEATRRGYNFDVRKVGTRRPVAPLIATRGQLEFEWTHLLRKLRRRSPAQFRALRNVARPRAHPLFHVRPGPVAAWERVNAD